MMMMMMMIMGEIVVVTVGTAVKKLAKPRSTDFNAIHWYLQHS
jgi:hypothetical protein